MPAKTTWPRWCSAARRSAAPCEVAHPPRSTPRAAAGGASWRPSRCGRRCTAPPLSSPWAASTEIACSTLARQDAVENGRTMPVGAEDRDAADDTEPGVGGLARHPLAVRDRDDHGDALGAQVNGLPLRPGLIIARGTGVMAGPPSSSPRPGLVTTPTPHAAVQFEAGLAAPAHGGGQPRAVSHVRVVAGVLDHHGLGFTWYEGAFVHLEADPSATGQPDLHGVLHLAGCPARWWPPWPRRNAQVPVGPAGAQRLLPHLRRPRQVGLAQLGILAHVLPLVSRSCFLAWGSALRYPWKWPGCGTGASGCPLFAVPGRPGPACASRAFALLSWQPGCRVWCG